MNENKWKITLLTMFAIIIWFFSLLGYTNERDLEYHYITNDITNVDEYCDTLQEMYWDVWVDYEWTRAYELQECSIYKRLSKECEKEEAGTESLDMCNADLAMTEYNVLNIMR